MTARTLLLGSFFVLGGCSNYDDALRAFCADRPTGVCDRDNPGPTEHLWSRAEGGTSSLALLGLDAHATDGSFAIGGYFNTPGAIFGRTALPAPTGEAAYVSAYSDEGIHRWVRVVDGAGSDRILDVQVNDARGTVAVLGETSSASITFDGEPASAPHGLFGKISFVGLLGPDGVQVAPLTTLGGEASGGSVHAAALSSPADALEGLYVTGSFTGDVNMQTHASGGPDGDFFLHRLGSDAWTAQSRCDATSVSGAFARGMDVAASQNLVWVVGRFIGPCTLFSAAASSTSKLLPDEGTFIAVYTNTGDLREVRTFSNSQTEDWSISAEGSFAWAAGTFSGSVTFDSPLATNGQTRALLLGLQLDAALEVTYSAITRGFNQHRALDVQMGIDGSAWVAGDHDSSEIEFFKDTTKYPGNVVRRSWVAKVNRQGQTEYARSFGGNDQSAAFVIGQGGALGEVVVGGTFLGGGLNLGGETLSAPVGSNQAYLWRLRK